jgi:hypothetical protein
MKINTKLTISRPINSDGGSYINIRIEDCTSGAEFVKLQIGLAEFTEALTGLSYVECAAEVHGLAVVGMKKERERAKILLPKRVGYDRKAIKEYLATYYDPTVFGEGWILDQYIGSQGSIVSNTDPDTKEEFPNVANVTYYRYVAVDNDQN